MMGSSRPSGAGAGSEQRLAAGGGTARASAWWLGGRGGLERGLDGVGDELRGLRVDGDVPAEQHATDDLPGVPWPGPWHVHRTRNEPGQWPAQLPECVARNEDAGHDSAEQAEKERSDHGYSTY